MNRSLFVALSLVALLWAMSTPALAQQRGQGRTAADRMFDPATVETVKGVIARIDTVQSRRGPSKGLHLQLQMADATLPVHLGPTWFFADQSFAFATDDSLTVRGSRVTMGGADALIAAELRRGDQSLQLRDETGRPVWRGQRRQNR